MAGSEEENRSKLSGCRILIVEDEYFLGDDVARTLATFGVEVVGPFGEVDEALAALESASSIHGAILDINLRGTMVFEIAAALQSRQIPFVFATGYDQAAIPAEFQHIPRWEKPFDPGALARALPSLVAGRC